MPSCGNIFVCLPTHDTVRPTSLLLWCLGVIDHGWIWILGVIRKLEHMTEVCWQMCHSKWRQWCWKWFVSRAAGRSLKQGMF
jgi:hypothetical protein